MAHRSTKPVPTWSANLAYAVGLITTDGNLSPDGRHISLVSKDLVQLECFKRVLGLTNEITPNQSTYNPTGVYWRIQFGNVVLYRWLESIGLMPNKSKVLGALLVPDAYFFDFLRGSLDGDGTFRVYQDPDYPNAQRLYTTFHSASLEHLRWIQAMTERLLNLRGYIGEQTRLWALNYAKGDSLRLLPKMYHHPDVPCLKRKYDLVREFLGQGEIAA